MDNNIEHVTKNVHDYVCKNPGCTALEILKSVGNNNYNKAYINRILYTQLENKNLIKKIDGNPPKWFANDVRLSITSKSHKNSKKLGVILLIIDMDNSSGAFMKIVKELEPYCNRGLNILAIGSISYNPPSLPSYVRFEKAQVCMKESVDYLICWKVSRYSYIGAYDMYMILSRDHALHNIASLIELDEEVMCNSYAQIITDEVQLLNKLREYQF